MRKEDYDTLIANLTPAIARFEGENAHELICFDCKTTRGYEITALTTCPVGLRVIGRRFIEAGWVGVTAQIDRVYCPLCADRKGLS